MLFSISNLDHSFLAPSQHIGQLVQVVPYAGGLMFIGISFPAYMKDSISFLKAQPVSLTLKAKRKAG